MWFATCDEWSSKDPEAQIWTLSEDPAKTGWETDNGFPGYGLTKAKAELLANAANLMANSALLLELSPEQIQKFKVEWNELLKNAKVKII